MDNMLLYETVLSFLLKYIIYCCMNQLCHTDLNGYYIVVLRLCGPILYLTAYIYGNTIEIEIKIQSKTQEFVLCSRGILQLSCTLNKNCTYTTVKLLKKGTVRASLLPSTTSGRRYYLPQVMVPCLKHISSNCA